MAGSDTDVSSEVADQTPGAPSSALDPATAAKVEQIATTDAGKSAALKGQISKMLAGPEGGGTEKAVENAKLAEKSGFIKNFRDNLAADKTKGPGKIKDWADVAAVNLAAGGRIGKGLKGAVQEWWKNRSKADNGVRESKIPEKKDKAAANKEAFKIQQDFEDIAKRSASDYKPGKDDGPKLNAKQAIEARAGKMKDLDDLKGLDASPEVIGLVEGTAAKSIDLKSMAADRKGVTDAQFEESYKQQQQLAGAAVDDLKAGEKNINDDALYTDADRESFADVTAGAKDIQAQPKMKGRSEFNDANEDELSTIEDGLDATPDGQEDGPSIGADEDEQDDLEMEFGKDGSLTSAKFTPGEKEDEDEDLDSDLGGPGDGPSPSSFNPS